MKDFKEIFTNLKEFWVEDRREFIINFLATLGIFVMMYISMWIAAILNGTV